MILAGFVWALWSGLTAALFLCCGLLALFIYHLRNLAKLMNWAREPLGTPTPHALGTWDHIFAALARRSRIAYDQRERLSQTLARFREKPHRPCPMAWCT